MASLKCPPDLSRTFPARLRWLLGRRGLNALQLVRLADLDLRALLASPPSKATLAAVCRVLDCDPDFLVSGRLRVGSFAEARVRFSWLRVNARQPM